VTRTSKILEGGDTQYGVSGVFGADLCAGEVDIVDHYLHKVWRTGDAATVVLEEDTVEHVIDVLLLGVMEEELPHTHRFFNKN
jgi:hypothetical protein